MSIRSAPDFEENLCQECVVANLSSAMAEEAPESSDTAWGTIIYAARFKIDLDNGFPTFPCCVLAADDLMVEYVEDSALADIAITKVDKEINKITGESYLKKMRDLTPGKKRDQLKILNVNDLSGVPSALKSHHCLVAFGGAQNARLYSESFLKEANYAAVERARKSAEDCVRKNIEPPADPGLIIHEVYEAVARGLAKQINETLNLLIGRYDERFEEVLNYLNSPQQTFAVAIATTVPKQNDNEEPSILKIRASYAYKRSLNDEKPSKFEPDQVSFVIERVTSNSFIWGVGQDEANRFFQQEYVFPDLAWRSLTFQIPQIQKILLRAHDAAHKADLASFFVGRNLKVFFSCRHYPDNLRYTLQLDRPWFVNFIQDNTNLPRLWRCSFLAYIHAKAFYNRFRAALQDDHDLTEGIP